MSSNTVTFKFGFGDLVKDKVTGFQGIVVGQLAYNTGCLQYDVRPPVNEKGEHQCGLWLDEASMEIVTPNKVSIIPDEDGPGGPSRGPAS